MLKKPFVAGLALALLSGAYALQQQGILLRRQLKEGTVEKYAVDMKMTTVIEMPSGLGEQELGLTTAGEYELKFGGMNWQIPGATAEATMKVTKMQAEGIMAGAFGDKVPEPVTTKTTVDVYGRMKSSTPNAATGLDPAQMQSMSSSLMFIELPEKPVTVGDTWQITIPKSPMTKERQFLTATIAGQHDGIFDVKLAGTYKIEMEPRAVTASQGPAQMQGQKVGIKGDVTVDGKGQIEIATGRTLTLTVRTKTKQEVSMPDMGMKINSESTLDSDVRLIK